MLCIESFGRGEAGSRGNPQIQIQTQTSPGLLERDANHHGKMFYYTGIAPLEVIS